MNEAFAPRVGGTATVQDLWLASQASQHSHRFLTRNRRDFEDIPGLDLVLYQLTIRTSPRDS
jgi:predicted nucleic acid-binding protein